MLFPPNKNVFQVDTSESKVYLWVGASTMVEYTYDEGLLNVE